MEKIIVIDFGGQYAHLIASSIRKLGAACELWQPETPIENFNDSEIKGIIFSGGPSSVYDPLAPAFDAENFFEKIKVPVLGICYGHQLIAQTFAKKYYSAVEKNPGKGEYGPADFEIFCQTEILNELLKKEGVWMSHEDSVSRLPPDFMLLGSSPNSRYCAIQHICRPIFGVQFHPEVTHTSCGQKVLNNFLGICQIKKEWTADAIFNEAKKLLIDGVGENYAVIFVSGGVDSSVLLELAKQNLPENKLFAIYVDTGLGEKDETKMVKETLTGKKCLKFLGSGKLPDDVEDCLISKYQKDRFHNLRVVDAKSRFFRALKNIYDPEKKREIIGNLFIKIWRQEVKKLDLPPEKCVLLQGTIYPDTIETARTAHSEQIKIHHNRVPKIKEIKNIAEPLQYLYKDEVRLLGKKLRVDESILSRHPRPGPGNAVRILCSKYDFWPPLDEKLKKALDAELDEICRERKIKLKYYLLPIQSTGVQGDQRAYGYTIAILTKENPEKIWNELIDVASQIVNSHKGIINRVVLVLRKKYPGSLTTIGLKKSHITKEKNKLLQEIEAIVKKNLIAGNWYNFVWQFPVVLAPLGFNLKGESIILRPVDSINAMTASVHKLPWPMVKNICDEILDKYPEIMVIFYDLTSKPPGTIEWE